MFGRSRWAALGAVVAVLLGGGAVLTASAAGSANASSFVPITPCRLLDTRTGPTTSVRGSTPLGADETYVALGVGHQRGLHDPDRGDGVVDERHDRQSDRGVVPDGVPARTQPGPLTSNLNWVAGQAPTPNAVTAPLSADGKIGLYNIAGTVDRLVDIVGYYELASSGPAGTPGAPGATRGQG